MTTLSIPLNKYSVSTFVSFYKDGRFEIDPKHVGKEGSFTKLFIDYKNMTALPVYVMLYGEKFVSFVSTTSGDAIQPLSTLVSSFPPYVKPICNSGIELGADSMIEYQVFFPRP